MATSANGVAFATNGLPPDDQAEADHLSKLLQFEREVITGSRPEYKLRQSDADKLLASLQRVYDSSPPETAQTSTKNSFSLSPPSTDTGVTSQSMVHNVNLPSRPHPREPSPPAVPSVAQFDPVLLQKSDKLLQAEAHLKQQREQKVLNELMDKRQKIERALKDPAQAKEQNRPGKDDVTSFLSPLVFDGDVVLEAALELVKPVHGVEQTIIDEYQSDTKSFDDDYYSSRGNSWSTQQTNEPNHTVDKPAQLDKQTHNKALIQLDGPIEDDVVSAPRGRVSGLGPQTVPQNVPARVTSTIRTAHAAQSGVDNTDFSGDSEFDDDNSTFGSYSPPAADALISNDGPDAQYDSRLSHLDVVRFESASSESGWDNLGTQSQNHAQNHAQRNNVPQTNAPQATAPNVNAHRNNAQRTTAHHSEVYSINSRQAIQRNDRHLNPALSQHASSNAVARVQDSESYSPPPAAPAPLSMNRSLTNSQLHNHGQGQLNTRNGRVNKSLIKHNKIRQRVERNRLRKETTKATTANSHRQTGSVKSQNTPRKRVRYAEDIAEREDVIEQPDIREPQVPFPTSSRDIQPQVTSLGSPRIKEEPLSPTLPSPRALTHEEMFYKKVELDENGEIYIAEYPRTIPLEVTERSFAEARRRAFGHARVSMPTFDRRVSNQPPINPRPPHPSYDASGRRVAQHVLPYPDDDHDSRRHQLQPYIMMRPDNSYTFGSNTRYKIDALGKRLGCDPAPSIHPFDPHDPYYAKYTVASPLHRGAYQPESSSEESVPYRRTNPMYVGQRWKAYQQPSRRQPQTSDLTSNLEHDRRMLAPAIPSNGRKRPFQAVDGDEEQQLRRQPQVVTRAQPPVIDLTDDEYGHQSRPQPSRGPLRARAQAQIIDLTDDEYGHQSGPQPSPGPLHGRAQAQIIDLTDDEHGHQSRPQPSRAALRAQRAIDSIVDGNNHESGSSRAGFPALPKHVQALRPNSAHVDPQRRDSHLRAQASRLRAVPQRTYDDGFAGSRAPRYPAWNYSLPMYTHKPITPYVVRQPSGQL